MSPQAISNPGHECRARIDIDTKVQVKFDGFGGGVIHNTRRQDKKFGIDFRNRNDDIALRYSAYSDRVSLNSKPAGAEWQKGIPVATQFTVNRPCVIIFEFFGVDGARWCKIHSEGGNDPMLFELRMGSEADKEFWISLTQNCINPVISWGRFSRMEGA